MLVFFIGVTSALEIASLPFSPSVTDAPIESPHHIQFTQTQIFILFAAGTWTLLVIIVGAVVTAWCRRRNLPRQLRLPEDEGYAAETGVYDI
jgi:hypothetical protein